MKRGRLLVAVLGVLSLTGLVLGLVRSPKFRAALMLQQKQAPPKQDPQAVSVLHRSLAAMGAQVSSQALDTLVQATITSPNAPDAPGVPTTIETLGPDRFRIDSQTSKGTVSVVHDRGRYMRSSAAGWKQGPSANSMFKRPEHLPAVLLVYELDQKNLEMTYVGLETLGTASVHHIRLRRISALGNELDDQMTKNSQIDLFIDAQSFLLLKVSYPYFSKIDWRISKPMEIYYENYQNQSGIMVPFHQRAVFGGNPLYVLDVNSVAFNHGNAAADFEVR